MKNLIIGGIIRLGTMVGCSAEKTAAKDMHPSDASLPSGSIPPIWKA